MTLNHNSLYLSNLFILLFAFYFKLQASEGEIVKSWHKVKLCRVDIISRSFSMFD